MFIVARDVIFIVSIRGCVIDVQHKVSIVNHCLVFGSLYLGEFWVADRGEAASLWRLDGAGSLGCVK